MLQKEFLGKAVGERRSGIQVGGGVLTVRSRRVCLAKVAGLVHLLSALRLPDQLIWCGIAAEWHQGVHDPVRGQEDRQADRQAGSADHQEAGIKGREDSQEDDRRPP